jgi:class 3 adenylate cyclase
VATPTGTVTFLFTDIEGSTRLWQASPAEMPTALQRHDALIKSWVEAHDGYVFSTGGDGFAAAFSRAGDAAAAVAHAQAALGEERYGEAVATGTALSVESATGYAITAVDRIGRVGRPSTATGDPVDPRSAPSLLPTD